MTTQKQKRNTSAHDGQNLTENTNMQIEKGIPMPESQSVGIRVHHDLYSIVESMQIGDSFLARDNLIFKGCFSTKAYLEKKYGIKLAQRKTPEGLRIWRTA